MKNKQAAVEWFYDKIKSHFEHDGDLLETLTFTMAIAKKKEAMAKNLFIICTIRSATQEYLNKLETYVSELESKDVKVYAPHRDTNQMALGYEICKQNMQGIIDADEVHIFYNSKSQGTHFDMGMAFALGKKIVIIENEPLTEGKSFQRMLVEWQQSV